RTVLNCLARGGEIVVGKNSEICELSRFDLTLLADLGGKPRVGLGPEPQRGFAVELIRSRIELQSAKCATGHQPCECDPGIVRRHARCVGASADGDPHLQHSPNGWRAFSLLDTVTFNEVLALIGHAVLDGDAAAKFGDPLDVSIVDGLAMVEQPVQAAEWNFT